MYTCLPRATHSVSTEARKCEHYITFCFLRLAVKLLWDARSCLKHGEVLADLYCMLSFSMMMLMPLPLTVSCFSKIQIGFTFLVPAHLGSPGKRAVKRVCVCVKFKYQLMACC